MQKIKFTGTAFYEVFYNRVSTEPPAFNLRIRPEYQIIRYRFYHYGFRLILIKSNAND
jgi:hypothetical protein